MIDFGTTNGSTEAGNVVHPYIKRLFEIFYEDALSPPETYFSGLDNFEIMFLVSGKHKSFNSEGPEGLSKVHGEDIILIYYAIPEQIWSESSKTELKQYLAKAVTECFHLLVNKALKIKKIKSLEKLKLDFDKSIELFLHDRTTEL